MLDRELLLRGHHERLPPAHREIEDRQRIPNRNAHHPRAIDGICELKANGHERDDHGERGAGHAEGTAIGALDIGKAAAKLNEGEALQQVREHGAEHRHVEEHAANEGAGVLAAHGEPDNQHHGEAERGAGDERNIRGLVLAVGDRQEMREIAGA